MGFRRAATIFVRGGNGCDPRGGSGVEGVPAHTEPDDPMTARLNRLAALLLLTLALVAGCSDSTGPAPRVEDATFAPQLGVDLTSMTRRASGLYVQDRVVGGGAEAVAGSQVEVHYRGWLVDGTVFDQNLSGQHDALPFQVGGGRMIPGFEEGVRGMRVGGKRLLVIPPSLGYGSRPQGSIPGNSILVFEVELARVR
jgi:FKBP-type peptidyl-prolyl cis-trans isomerase FkpA